MISTILIFPNLFLNIMDKHNGHEIIKEKSAHKTYIQVFLLLQLKILDFVC